MGSVSAARYFPRWLIAPGFGFERRTRVYLGKTPPRRRKSIPLEAIQSPEALSSAIRRLRVKGALDVLVDPGELLTRDVAIPSRALKDADRILGRDLAQNTPFRPEDVATTLGPWHKEAGQAHATQYLMKREIVERLAQAAANAGVREITISPALSSPTAPLARLGGQKDRATAIWAAITGLLLLAVAGLGYHHLSRTTGAIEDDLGRIEAQNDRLRARAMAAVEAGTTAGESMERESAAHDLLRRFTPRLVLLEGLTRSLDDEIWLSELDIRFTDVTLSGFAEGRTLELIPALAAQPWADAPSLIGPIVQDQRTGRERFRIGFQSLNSEVDIDAQ